MQHPDEIKWDEYKILVLDSLEKLDHKCDSIEKKLETRTEKIFERLDRINTKVAVLETKAFFFGAVAGLVVTTIFEVIIGLIKH